MHSRMTLSVLLLASIGATACSSSVYQRVVKSNPTTASIYINGVKVGNGDPKSRSFDFSEVDRVYIMAVHPSYEVRTQVLTEQEMRNDVDMNVGPLNLSMRAR